MCCASGALCSALDGPVDWGLIQHLGSKAAVVYNPRDPWFQQYDTMHEVLPEVEVSKKSDNYENHTP